MKIKIRTNLVSGVLMGLFSVIMLLCMPSQVRVPAYDSGAPSPRIIPGICLAVILFFSIVLIVQSLVFKKERIVVFDWQKEKPAIILIAAMCIYVALILTIGYTSASIIIFCAIQFYCGERKPFIYIFTIAAAVVIYFIFQYLFNVALPEPLFL